VTDARIPLGWTPRHPPLSARAVVASGAAARALGRRVAELHDDAMRTLTAVAGDDVLVVLGDSSALPWIDGVTYLGRDEAAPDLLLPTAVAPTIPVAVLETAVRRLVLWAAPVAVLPAPARLIPCGAARAIDRGRLAAWLEAR
jgi:hypothetical protein